MSRINYECQYTRVVIRGTALESLQEPKTFALWGKQRMEREPVMLTWQSPQWVIAFLQDRTGVPWIISATNLDLEDFPRHDPLLPLEKHERTTDDPPLPLPSWVVDLLLTNCSGAEMVRFIQEILSPLSSHSSAFDKSFSRQHSLYQKVSIRQK
jgi:hypothetical protein